MSKINNVIIDNTVKNLKFREYKESEDWITKYNGLSKEDKLKVIRDFNKIQGEFIKSQMKSLQNPIKLANLGSFIYKQSRKDFYDIKETSPDLSLDEIVKQVKQSYYDREVAKKKLKKFVKNRAIYINIQK